MRDQMNSISEVRLPLEAFHRHFALTHWKEKAPKVFDELTQQAERSGRLYATLLAERIKSQYPQSGFQDDNWFVTQIRIAWCYFAQTDFRHHPVPKNQRFVDFLPTQSEAIKEGSFPCCIEIRAPWIGPMPEPLVQEREPERFYVLDGQLRVTRHWYHNIPDVRVFVYRGKLDV